MKKYRMYKGHMMHINQIAAISRRISVNNVNKTMPNKHEYKLVYDENIQNAITNPFTGHKFVPTNPHPVPIKFGTTVTGYDWVEPKGKLWVIPEGGFKQPKRLRKKYKKKYYCKHSYTIRKVVGYPSNFPINKVKEMGHVEYMEKLVQHKLTKWERNHPQPCPNDDLFKVEYQAAWREEYDKALERFRDFVVSIYDKLPLTGRFKVNHPSATYMEEKVAELKDINGDGHRVNEMTENSPLLKKAKDITNKVRAKRNNLVATNLKDHKRQKGRIILPDSKLRNAALNHMNLYYKECTSLEKECLAIRQ